jgi:hypothetical protein
MIRARMLCFVPALALAAVSIGCDKKEEKKSDPPAEAKSDAKDEKKDEKKEEGGW